MRFGIFDHVDDLGDGGAVLAGRLDLLEDYDRLGFRGYHLAEHHGTPLGLAPSPHLFLAAASQRTTRLRLGTMVSVLPLYHPLRLIEEVAMLDHLTGGRLDLGVGRGSSAIETGFYGVPGEETPARFAEQLEILRLGLASERLTYEGRWHRLEDVPMALRPVQEPHPPLWFGARDGDRAAWAASQGLNVMALSPSTAVRAITDRYREAWAAAGGPPEAMPLMGASRPIVLADSADEAMRIARRAFARHVVSFEWVWNDAGIPCPTIYLSDDFADIHRAGEAYAGTPEGAVEFIAGQVERSGVTYLALDLAFGDVSVEEAQQTAELFAAHVAPAFAGQGAPA
jgi:alkanesulfonate monooxygenase SsuD/methylene tetrahydromethanopterin reductase-like flavin-dependent oxidoreductase (luciferase family)